MAGFDFSLSVTDRQMNFARTLLRSVQKWGRRYEVRFRYRREKKVSFICIVDGPLIRIQLLEAYIATCLPVLADVSEDSLTNSERARFICKFIQGYNEGLCQLHAFVVDSAGLFNGIPNSINFDYGLNSNLGDYLQGLALSFVNYLRGNVTPRQHAEECHTAIEVLCMQFRKDGSWENKIDAAIEAGVLSKKYKNELVRLKDLRKRAKHRGQIPSEEDFKAILPTIINSIHELVVNIGKNLKKTVT